MKRFYALFKARNVEFFRDKGALAWSMVFPLLIVFGCAVAFSSDQDELFRIGLYQTSAEQKASLDLLNEPFVKTISYDSLEKAKQRISHHQLHLLVDASSQQYWLNPSSYQGKVLEQLMHGTGFKAQTLEGAPIRYVDWVIPGVLGMNIMFASLFGVGYIIVRYRKNGVLKRFQATPINAFEFVSAQVASRLFVILSSSIVIYIGSDFFIDFMMLGRYIDLFLVAVLGAIAMIAMGLAIASRTASEELAGGLLNASTWPMMFLSGVWFSLDDAPAYMQWLANAFPLTHLVAAARDIMINGASLVDVMPHLMVLCAMVAVFLTIASLLFSWSKE